MSPVDNQLDQVMEEMDENEEEMEVDAAADEHVDGRLNAENEDMNDEVDDELGDADDPFTDGPSQQPVSRARLPGHAIASIHSPAEESASASSQASGFVDGPPRSHPAPPQEQAKPSQASQPTATVQPGMSSVVEPYRPSVPPEALTATSYDIVPTIAAPHATSINAIAATPNLRWVFTGGADGYIRKYGWVESVNGRVMLTVAQRHPFVDSVTKAGVLLSYWENEDVQRMYSSQPFHIYSHEYARLIFIRTQLEPQSCNQMTTYRSRPFTLWPFTPKRSGCCRAWTLAASTSSRSGTTRAS